MDKYYFTPAALAAGFLLDQAVGDPHWLYHPVRLIGKETEVLERLLRAHFPQTPEGEQKAGLVLCLAVSGSAVLTVGGLRRILGKTKTSLFLTDTVLTSFLLASRSLRDESGKVEEALRTGDIEASRKAVSGIVGRDTGRLNPEEIAKAAVETVAENTSDGIVTPLFYLALGGPEAGWFSKAVNTMDSMVGYKNERYLHFGRAAAKLDDAVNYLPSRLSALLFILSAEILGEDGKGALRIWMRDRRKHKSPNSAQTESACAGALGLRLGGDAYYFGKLQRKPFLGDEKKKTEAGDIRRANRLELSVSVLGLFLALPVRALIRKP